MNLANCDIRVGDSQGIIWKFLENLCMLSADVHMPACSCSQKLASPHPHSTSCASTPHWQNQNLNPLRKRKCSFQTFST